MIFDSDVIIWFTRGHYGALDAIAEAPRRGVSVISYMEVIQGALNRREGEAIKRLLVENQFEIISLSEMIGQRAAGYIEEHALSTGLRLADALVAATAVERDLELCTADKRHYRPIRDLRVRAFRP